MNFLIDVQSIFFVNFSMKIIDFYALFLHIHKFLNIIFSLFIRVSHLFELRLLCMNCFLETNLILSKFSCKFLHLFFVHRNCIWQMINFLAWLCFLQSQKVSSGKFWELLLRSLNNLNIYFMLLIGDMLHKFCKLVNCLFIFSYNIIMLSF